MSTLSETGQDVPVIQPASQRLFSEEVGAAAGDNPLPPQDPAYVWSNGRTFYDGPKPGSV